MIEAHLDLVPAFRSNGNGRAFRLNEPAMPLHDGTPESTLGIVRWLNVEKSERYRPGGGSTYCNIYAVDVCHLLGAYLPRVWWLPNALADIAKGGTPTARYAATVGELSANALFRWLAKHSQLFGWRRTDSLNDAQEAANAGCAVVICARRTVEAASGHISVVVPESDRCRAKVDAHGMVLQPVQSQAGGRNVEIGILGGPWWLGREMAEWGCWIHEPLMADTIPAPSSAPDTDPQTPTSKSTQNMAAVDPGTGTNDWRPLTDVRTALPCIFPPPPPSEEDP